MDKNKIQLSKRVSERCGKSSRHCDFSVAELDNNESSFEQLKL